ncbi:MAG TPA: hypothetical protein VEY12_00725 [Thermoplasmata archaeon]|nr:hypothetical protein [Thermoplasmata archaeon]
MDRDTALRYLVSGLLVAGAVAIALYWVLYFFVGGTQVVNEVWYTRFENAFPVADAWTAVLGLVAAYFLLRRNDRMAPFFLAAAGASGVYLAFMDITFNLENNLYALVATNGNMQTELAINVAVVVISLVGLAYGLMLLRKPPSGG